MVAILRTLDIDATSSEIEAALRSEEEAGYTCVSLSSGLANGQIANILTLTRPPSRGLVHVHVLDGALAHREQTQALNALVTPDDQIVSYSAVWIEGALENVALIRTHTD